MGGNSEIEARTFDRGTALVLGLISGFFWLVYGLAEMISLPPDVPWSFPQSFGLGLILILSSAIAWEWDAVGGLIMVMEGIFAIYIMLLAGLPLTVLIFFVLALGLPPLAAGSLFLLGWLEDRRTQTG